MLGVYKFLRDNKHYSDPLVVSLHLYSATTAADVMNIGRLVGMDVYNMFKEQGILFVDNLLTNEEF